MADPTIRIKLTSLKCLKQTGDPGSDEPYVVVFTALAKLPQETFSAFPQGIVTLSQTIDDVDEGESHRFGGGVSIWGIADHARSAATMTSDNVTDLIILVALMESDGSTTGSIRAVSQAIMYGTLASYVLAGWNRRDAVHRLREDLSAAIQIGAVTNPSNQDDQIGPILELPVTQSMIDGIEPGGRHAIILNFQNQEDGGHYEVRFLVERTAA